MIITLPILICKNIPLTVKGFLAITLCLILYPILSLKAPPLVDNVIFFGLGAIGEILLGVSIGLFVKMVLAGITLAGQLSGFQMGLAIANVYDPATSNQVPIIGQIYNLIALLILLAVNAHYWFLIAVAESFHIVPPLHFQMSNNLMVQLISLGSNMFVIAIKVGAPVIVVMLLTSVVFGLVARTVPQMNVFIVAMPVKIIVGLIFLAVSLPYISNYISGLLNESGSNITTLLNAMK